MFQNSHRQLFLGRPAANVTTADPLLGFTSATAKPQFPEISGTGLALRMVTLKEIGKTHGIGIVFISHSGDTQT